LFDLFFKRIYNFLSIPKLKAFLEFYNASTGIVVWRTKSSPKVWIIGKRKTKVFNTVC